MDTYGYIYKDNFDPFNPSENLIFQDDGRLNNRQFSLIIHLQVSTAYVLVVTTDSPNVIGAFTISVSGRNNVSLNRKSEYLYYFGNNEHRMQ